MTDYTQTTFGYNPPSGAPGELDYHTAMYGADDAATAAVDIPFGRGVFSAAATPNSCALPTTEAEAGRLRGISVKDLSKPSGVGYKTGEDVRISRSGRMRVYFETAIADKAPVYVRITESATGAGDIGQFRGDTDSGKAIAVTAARACALDGVISAAGVNFIEYDFRPGA